MGSAPANVRELWRTPRADGPAAVLAIGTANPANCVLQDEFPDLHFRITKSEHLVDLKEKFKTLCKKTPCFGIILPNSVSCQTINLAQVSITGQKMGVSKRYLHCTEELLGAHPEFIDPHSPSLDARLDIVKTAVPELAAEASRRAIAEWGRPATDITHLVVTTNSGAHIPGVDFQLDLAENNRGARVLVVCAEINVLLVTKPEEGSFHSLVHQGVFGDGAGAVIVGAADDPAMTAGERPLFEIFSAAQAIIPESENIITMQITKSGYGGDISTGQIHVLIGDNIERCLLDALEPLGIGGATWNDLFWVMHPGTSVIMNQVSAVLQLEPEKLAASRRVLSEYGNMLGVTVMFVLDEVRRRMEKGEEEGAPEWGLMVACGPGLTVETMVLRRCVAQGTGAPAEDKPLGLRMRG
ncbi:hypothetical protein HU200_034234 [Digitaria exilis]|uniref:Chalcone synthase n=1 Tax=Digitaria exilis TaxID=1010633 RepID=A0A835EP74_9POAL|nr:hypothetical protein HU200_034234 [Digitaria exilis]